MDRVGSTLGERGAQQEGKRRTRRPGDQRHVERLEARDIGDGVVDGRLERRRVRPAIRHRQEGIAAGIGQARADAAQDIGRQAVFEIVGQAREVDALARRTAGQASLRDQKRLCMGGRNGRAGQRGGL